MIKILMFLLLINFAPPIYQEASGEERELFPVPAGLEKNVVFWEKIFKEYSINQVVIHDSEHLDVIYEVLDFRDNPNISNKTKNAKIQNCKAKYIRILNTIISNESHPEKLKGDELIVFRKFEGISEKNRFRKSLERIRAQNGIKERFLEGYIRSKRYSGDFRRIFRKHGLPEELTYLPHVESSFNEAAYSKCGAAGIWQFTKSTGKMFLKINKHVDERRDPYISTDAAARLLKMNYEALGEWPLAITAYNHGLNGMKNAKNTVKTTDLVKIAKEYKSKSFGFASRNFYAEFLAARNVAKEFEALETPTEIATSDMDYLESVSKLLLASAGCINCGVH